MKIWWRRRFDDDETWRTRWQPTEIGELTGFIIRYLFLAVVLFVFSPVVTPWSKDAAANWAVWGLLLGPVILGCILAFVEIAADIRCIRSKSQTSISLPHDK